MEYSRKMESVINKKAPKECCSARNVLWYLVFAGFAVNYMIRLNLNIAIVSMVKPKAKNVTIRSECDTVDIFTLFNKSDNSIVQNSLENSSTIKWIKNETASEKPIPKSKRAADDPERIYFNWNEKEQGNVLGSYFWLHWITQIPGGILAAKYGTKMVFGWSNFLGVIISYLIPWFAHRGTMYLIFIRGLQGLLCGFAWPSMHNMTAKWIPPNERSKFVTAYIGSSVGAAVTYPLCGFIIDRWGWEAVFYTCGVLGTIWFAAWWGLVHDSPEEHPRISLAEKEYILSSLGKSVSNDIDATPWRKILTDRSVLANVMAQIAGNWGMFTLTMNGPSYFNFIHGWNIRATGLLSGMPHVFRIVFAYFVSLIGDYLLRSNKMKRTNVRKLATFFSGGVQGIFMMALAYSGCNKLAAISFLTLAVAMNGAVSTGPLACLLDISPNYSGILLGICNTMVSVVGFCTPEVVGYFTYQNQTTTQWQKVFWVASGLLFASTIIHLIFHSSNLATWNSSKKENLKCETEMMVIKNGANKAREECKENNVDIY